MQLSLFTRSFENESELPQVSAHKILAQPIRARSGSFLATPVHVSKSPRIRTAVVPHGYHQQRSEQISPSTNAKTPNYPRPEPTQWFIVLGIRCLEVVNQLRPITALKPMLNERTYRLLALRLKLEFQANQTQFQTEKQLISSQAVGQGYQPVLQGVALPPKKDTNGYPGGSGEKVAADQTFTPIISTDPSKTALNRANSQLAHPSATKRNLDPHGSNTVRPAHFAIYPLRAHFNRVQSPSDPKKIKFNATMTVKEGPRIRAIAAQLVPCGRSWMITHLEIG